MSSSQHVRNRYRYRFGEFVLDPAARELRHVKEVLVLAPKVFDCIVYLVENRDRAIGHDEITAAVWGRADVSDVQLRQLLRKVRRTLDDDGDRQRVIRTVPHFGFHWVAAVEVEDRPDALSAPASGSPPTLPAQPRTASRMTDDDRRRWIRIAAATTLVALIASATGTYLWLHRTAAPGPTTTSDVAASVPRSQSDIAVLPFAIDAADDGDLAWMRLGIMDLVASRLRKASLTAVPSSDIVALASTRTADASLPVRVREATGARDLVLPSASRIGGDWRVRLDLLREDGSQRRVEARAVDAVTAARDASDRLLALLGKAPPEDPNAEVPKSLTEILAAVGAAKLVSDYAAAERALAATPVELRDAPEWQLNRAQLDIETYHPEDARVRLTKLLGSVSAEANPVLRARVLISLGRIDLGRPDQAIPRYTEAIVLLGNADEPGLLGKAYNGRGIAHGRGDHYGEAREDFARARVAYTVAGDNLGRAAVNNNDATLESSRGRTTDALSLFERAAYTFEQFGALDAIASAFINRISIHLELLQPDKAIVIYKEAESKLRNLDDARVTNILRQQYAESLAAIGRLREARAALEDVLQKADPAKEGLVVAGASRLYAQLDLADGQFESAGAFARRTIDILASVRPDSGECASAWIVLARALRGLHRDADAKSETLRFSAWAEGATRPGIVLRARLAEAEQAWAEGLRILAEQRYAEALQIATDQGVPYELAEVTRSYGNALLDVGKVAQAAVLVGSTERWNGSSFDLALLRTRLYHALGQREAWQSALRDARKLAGERSIPSELILPPPEIAERG